MCKQKPIIMSLGYNCEVSFRVEDYLGKLDSYLYSWSFEEDRLAFLKSLSSIEDVFCDAVRLQPDHMIRDEKYRIKFHPRYDILSKYGFPTPEAYQSALKELKNRIEHLKRKTINVMQGSQSIVFLMKVEDHGEKNNILYLRSVLDILKSQVKCAFVLVAVMEKKSLTEPIRSLQEDTLQIRTVKRFAPVKHTDIMGDIRGWYKILCEFSEVQSKCYYKNLWHRKIKLYPQMVFNKIKRVMSK